MTQATDELDPSDKPLLYALLRHFEARTPHYEATMNELAAMAENPSSEIPFTAEERANFGFLRTHKEEAKAMFNTMASSLAWTESAFRGAGMAVLRSPVPLRASTIPVLAIPSPQHPAIRLPLPGMVPYTLVLTLSPSAAVSLTLGDFDGEFVNREMDRQTALGFNRYFVGQFAHFPLVRHLLADRGGLVEDMAWAHYVLHKDDQHKMTFRRSDPNG